MLRVMFRNELFENNTSKPLDWNKIYPGWNSESHRELARKVARESIVMLENKSGLLPLSKDIHTIAVLGPGADNLQPGDYTPKLQPGQLKSVLAGIKDAVSKQTKVLYEQGCDFTTLDGTNIPKAVKIASQADVIIMVLGDCSTSEATGNVEKTSGENHGSIVEYKGEWYAFYHNSSISGRGNLRSICVDKLYYNPDGTIKMVEQHK